MSVSISTPVSVRSKQMLSRQLSQSCLFPPCISHTEFFLKVPPTSAVHSFALCYDNHIRKSLMLELSQNLNKGTKLPWLHNSLQQTERFQPLECLGWSAFSLDTSYKGTQHLETRTKGTHQEDAWWKLWTIKCNIRSFTVKPAQFYKGSY